MRNFRLKGIGIGFIRTLETVLSLMSMYVISSVYHLDCKDPDHKTAAGGA